jgi:hypothetical protein
LAGADTVRAVAEVVATGEAVEVSAADEVGVVDALDVPQAAIEPADSARAIGRTMILGTRGVDLGARRRPFPGRESFMRTTFLGRLTASAEQSPGSVASTRSEGVAPGHVCQRSGQECPGAAVKMLPH